MRVNFKNSKQRPLLIYSIVVTIVALTLLINISTRSQVATSNSPVSTPLTSEPTLLPTSAIYPTALPTTVNSSDTPTPLVAQSSSPVSKVNIPIVDTSSWKQVSYKGIGFKLPQSMKCYNYEKSMTAEADADCHNFIPDKAYLASTIEVEDYQGGSRRQQFLAKLPNNEAEICQYKYIESMFGSIDALQIANNGGQCQGGGGAIVTVVGNKLVYFPNLNYTDDGKISRWAILDTVVSSLKTLP